MTENEIKWQDMKDAPKDRPILLDFKYGGIHTGRFRRRNLDEPRQVGDPPQEVLYWRADCCERFSTPLRWANYTPLRFANYDDYNQ